MTTVIRYDMGRLKQDIALLPEKMLEAADEEIRQACNTMVGYAKVLVAVETGSLRDSIRIERGGEGLHWRMWRVRAGGYITNPKSLRLVDYAVFVEAKMPFMAPAFDIIKPHLEELIRRKVAEAMQP